MNIGIFDSGLGGLVILKEILAVLPEYDYIYLGDNAHMPYGDRSSEDISRLTYRAVDFLLQKNCDLIILACNTATSITLKKLQQKYLPQNYPQRKILGVIRPTVEAIIDKKLNQIAIIGTKATTKSQAFIREIHKFAPQINIFQLATPLLVPLIEKNKIDQPQTNLIIKKYLNQVIPFQPECLILGCTHYGLLENKFKKQLKNTFPVMSQGKIVAQKLKIYLKKHADIEKKLTKNHYWQFYVTELNTFYKNQIKLFLGKNFSKKEHLQLANYKV